METKTTFTNEDMLMSKMKDSQTTMSRRVTNLGSTQRRGSLVYFNDLKQQEEKKDHPEENDDDDNDYETMKMKIQMMNKDEVTTQINDFIFHRGDPDNKKKITTNENQFQKTRYASGNSFSNFFEKYKLSDKLLRKGISFTTPSFNLIKSLKENHLVPNPVGLVKRNGMDSSMNLNNYRLGDDYVTSLSSSLMLADHLSSINLSNNRLSDKGAVPLFDTFSLNSNLNKKIMVIDLSYNKLGREGISKLCDYIRSNECDLEHLNLEANSLGNELVIQVIDSLVNNLFYKLRYINFGQNNIDDHVAPAIAQLIERCENLQALILYWNQIRNYAASLIVSKIKKHQYMKFFDISWNLVGDCLVDNELNKIAEVKNTLNIELNRLNMTGPKGKKINVVKNSISAFAKELGELFKERTCGLIHLDISHNNIGIIDTAHICEEVKANHSILGIHCDGNEMTIDELGFIYPIEKNNEKISHYANSQIYYRIDNDHSLIKTNILNVRRIRGKNHCWICEGWREIKFHYKPSRHFGDKSALSVKLHLNFENYKAYDTVLHEEQFICYRMCPPGELLFYFTVNGVPAENSSQQITHKNDIHIHVLFII
jgi:hypothetical protein